MGAELGIETKTLPGQIIYRAHDAVGDDGVTVSN
jgi:hypothetical protein